jgi:hypothetical protein
MRGSGEWGIQPLEPSNDAADDTTAVSIVDAGEIVSKSVSCSKGDEAITRFFNGRAAQHEEGGRFFGFALLVSLLPLIANIVPQKLT